MTSEQLTVLKQRIGEEMLRKARQRLERLKNAADRMTRGNYGVCLRCNKEIAFERLNAIPEALVCVSCAEKPRR